MPEGLQYADYFDTYRGDLATVGGWSQAQPSQCGYPATPPSVGDYLTVEDTLCRLLLRVAATATWPRSAIKGSGATNGSRTVGC